MINNVFSYNNSNSHSPKIVWFAKGNKSFDIPQPYSNQNLTIVVWGKAVYFSFNCEIQVIELSKQIV